MPRQISEERIREVHAHKKMIDASTLPLVAERRPQLEQAGWYLRDHEIVNRLRGREFSCMLEAQP